MLQVIPSFFTDYSKKDLFISAITYEKYIVSKEYCIACRDNKICFLPKYRHHIIILIGGIKKLLKNLDAFCFNYQHVDGLCTLLKYRFSRKIFVTGGKIFDNVQRAVLFSHQICSGQNAQHCKNETLEQKLQKIFC